MENFYYICIMNDKSILNTKDSIPLCDLAEVISGVFLKSSRSGEVLYIQLLDMASGNPADTAAKVDYVSKLERYMIKPRDLLFAAKGASHLCQMFCHDVPAVPSTSLYIIRPVNNLVTTEYLCWYLNHPKVVATVKAGQVGSSTLMIHKSTLENLGIVVPDVATQRRIVEVDALQRREEVLLKSLAEKKAQFTSQILFNELIQQTTI